MFDPGPDGSIGDVSWIIEARTSGKLPLLIVQGVLMTDLARAADIVLPGASWIEKDAALRQRAGPAAGRPRGRCRRRATRRKTGRSSSTSASRSARRWTTRAAPHVRADVARGAWPATRATPASPSVAFARPVAAQHWLQASNPSERWKWDVMFQDLPPVKFAGRPEPSSIPGAISLQKID